ncbi:MAG: exodeoxyribonuclease V subunit beta [bacterium]|nr:exodeoxyribonuclease V subunit beta [bacterium]
MKKIDMLTSPLDGTNLIEASAGTGKTYTIAGLFLRLILEKKIPVNEILVVTFTEAATEELRSRVRKRLRDGLSILTGEKKPDPGDEFMEALERTYAGDHEAQQLLLEGLRRFDESAIFTIHSFCQRMLIEHAFESGFLFDTELLKDQDELFRDIVDDFWRKNFYSASTLLVRNVITRYNPASFIDLLRERSIDPSFEIIPRAEKPGMEFMEEALESLQEDYELLAKEWASSGGEIIALLNQCINDRGLSGTYYRKDRVPQWIENMNNYLQSELPLSEFKQLRYFSSTHLEKSTKKGFETPSHRFFDYAESLSKKQETSEALLEEYFIALKAELFEYAEQELGTRKEKLNVRSFDDLLENMHQALQGGAETDMAAAVRKRFKAALIDEFQDTDPVQYDIFNTIFAHSDSILFLIGDPKQAIFGFRGADIFAYMRASASVENRYTLGINWRSHPVLIDGVNRIFSRAKNPFLFNEIGFHPVEAPPAKEGEGLLIGGKEEPPLNFWFIDEQYGESKGFVAKGRAEALVAEAVAAEISRLISRTGPGKGTIGERDLEPGDIAVLVRANRQARIIQRELKKLSIPGVLYGGAESLFASHEAKELERVLAAIAEPGDDTKLKTALTTDIFGLSGHELLAVTEDELRWEGILNNFYGYHTLWLDYGFMRMFRSLMEKEGIRLRLLSFHDGERRMTNLLHCSEVLNQAELENKLRVESLLKWFAGKISDGEKADEHELRLETDENAVKLVTIHKSKGLEYPVVFCPFLWGNPQKRNRGGIKFHNPERENHLTLDLSMTEANKKSAGREELAENMRLLYVALTRAKHRCYLAWGKINETGSSALAYILHQHAELDPADPVEDLGKRVKGLTYVEMKEEVQALVDSSEQAMSLTILTEGEGVPYKPYEYDSRDLDYRHFAGSIDRSWVVSSYSSLVSGGAHSTEQPDYDREEQGEVPVLDEPEEDSIFAFPRGAKPGHCIHDIFENIDFCSDDKEALGALVAEKLENYGFDTAWQDVLSAMVESVLTTPLQESDTLTLRQIPNKDRLNELEFYFPLQPVEPAGLARVFADHGIKNEIRDFSYYLGKLDFNPVRGYMKGFMDLVFRKGEKYYIIDWKSNYLGPDISTYTGDPLRHAMESHFYILQYHLYTIALHKHLAVRLPGYTYEKNFGGIFYIFVRGVNPEQGSAYGIYRDIPAYELVESLCDYLIGSSDSGLNEAEQKRRETLRNKKAVSA